jgi:hypothetical protein
MMSVTSQLSELIKHIDNMVDLGAVKAQAAGWDTDSLVTLPYGVDMPFLGMSMLYRHRIAVAKSAGKYSALQTTRGGAFVNTEGVLDDDALSVYLAQADSRSRGNPRYFTQEQMQLTAETVNMLIQWKPRYQGVLQHLNPDFSLSGVLNADAGFILDNVLYSVRTTKTGMKPEYLYQALVYALLDAGDQYKIHSLGFVLTRQKAVHYIELSSIFKDIQQARRNFKFLIKTGER